MSLEITSILNSVKKALGIQPDYSHFDQELIMHINSVFSIINQLGVGPEETFAIESEDNTWEEFTESNVNINVVKTYMYLKVRLLFDPPSSGTVAESFKNQAEEMEWRMNVADDETWKEKNNGTE